MNNHQKVLIPAIILQGAAFLLPLYEVRPNRVAAGTAVSLLQLPRAEWAIALLLPLLLNLLLLLHPQDKKNRMLLVLTVPVSVIGFLLFMAGVSLHYGAFQVDAMRVGPVSGSFVFLAASMIIGLGIPFTRKEMLLIVLFLLGAGSILFFSGAFDTLGIVKEGMNRSSRLLSESVNHLKLAFIATGIASFFGIPAAFLCVGHNKFRKGLFSVINLFQTIPSLALFGLLIAPLAALGRAFPVLREFGIRGIGNTPAIIALTTYALFPVIRNSYTGIIEADPVVIESARAMGLSPGQMKKIIIIPLTLPSILHGVRLAAIQCMGNATLAKLIGAGGLGVFIFEGLGQLSMDMVWLGIILIALLTILTETTFQLLAWGLTPKPLRIRLGMEKKR